MIESDENGSETARRIPGDIVVDGLLRIADDTICEGSLTAPGGIILGQNVVVQGDVHTDGQVEVGPDSRIEGDVLPLREEILDPLATLHHGTQAACFAREPPPEKPRGAPRRLDDQVRAVALASTLDVLLKIALETHPAGDGQPGSGDLAEEALADTLEGAYRLMVDLYREGDAERPWGPVPVVDVLCKRVLPLVLPVSVTARGPDAVELRIRRPEPSTHRDDVPEDWTQAAVAFVEQLATTVRPRSNVTIQRIGPNVASAGPENLVLRVHFDAGSH